MLEDVKASSKGSGAVSATARCSRLLRVRLPSTDLDARAEWATAPRTAVVPDRRTSLGCGNPVALPAGRRAVRPGAGSASTLLSRTGGRGRVLGITSPRCHSGEGNAARCLGQRGIPGRRHGGVLGDASGMRRVTAPSSRPARESFPRIRVQGGGESRADLSLSRATTSDQFRRTYSAARLRRHAGSIGR